MLRVTITRPNGSVEVHTMGVNAAMIAATVAAKVPGVRITVEEA